ncbi:hypothetical protein EJB05_42109, partial [Eragrostis curvula]
MDGISGGGIAVEGSASGHGGKVMRRGHGTIAISDSNGIFSAIDHGSPQLQRLLGPIRIPPLPEDAPAPSTTPTSDCSLLFYDCYGQSIDLQSGGEQKQSWSAGPGADGSSFVKIEAESHEDASGYIKCLDGSMVLLRIALDGIRMLGTSSRTLKIYPLDLVKRCEALDSTIWRKTSVDTDAGRIRLKSNSYTTNNMFDTRYCNTYHFVMSLLMFSLMFRLHRQFKMPFHDA